MKSEANMVCRDVHHITRRLADIFVIFMTIFVVVFAWSEEENGDIEMVISFEEEQRIWDRWIENNWEGLDLFVPFYLQGEADAFIDIQKQITDRSRGKDLFLLYVRRNFNSGLFDITLLFKNENHWKQVKWCDAPEPNTTEETFDIGVLNTDSIYQNLDGRFHAEIKDRVLDGTGTYLFIFQNNRVAKRIAIYGVAKRKETIITRVAEVLNRTLSPKFQAFR